MSQANELGGRGEGGVVAHGHRVVEPVDADALAANPVCEPVSGAIDEDLLVDPGRAVLADVAGLAREDDRRFALARQEHVGVAVDDHEAREVGDRALEAGVLGAGDDRGVEAVALERLADQVVAAVDLRPGEGAHVFQDASTPLTSARIASCPGVGTP